MQHPTRFYYAPPAVLRSRSPLLIHGMGVNEHMNAGYVTHVHNVEYALLVHFADAVEVRLADRMQPVPAGSLLLWPARCGRVYGNREAPWLHSWINLVGAEADRVLESTGLPIGEPILLRDDDTLMRFQAALFEELEGQASPDGVMVDGLVRLLLHKLSRQAGDQPDRRVPAPLRAIVAGISSQLHRPIRLKELASRCHLSVSQFSALFTRTYRVSPMAYITQLRLNRAATLLAQQNRSIKEIAIAVGYADPLHFSRRFSLHHGMSPSSYRQRIAHSTSAPVERRAGR